MARKSGKSGSFSDEELLDPMPEVQEESYASTEEESVPVTEPLEPSRPDPTTVPLPTSVILKSKGFQKYQRDFARTLLPKATYSVKEAREILENYFTRKDGGH